jgi:hypothetical protein
MICGRIGVFLWFWSTLFHARDFSWTEKGDYFSAVGYLLYLLFLALIRIFNIWKKRHWWTIISVLGIYFLGHCTYLTYWPFDYGYNMAAGVIIGMSTNLLWVLWWLKVRKIRPYAYKQPLIGLLITLAMSLELFDFPPIWGILDEHALWHLSTIPIIRLHYSFLDSDARYEAMLKKDRLGGFS